MPSAPERCWQSRSLALLSVKIASSGRAIRPQLLWYSKGEGGPREGPSGRLLTPRGRRKATSIGRVPSEHARLSCGCHEGIRMRYWCRRHAVATSISRSAVFKSGPGRSRTSADDAATHDSAGRADLESADRRPCCYRPLQPATPSRPITSRCRPPSDRGRPCRPALRACTLPAARAWRSSSSPPTSSGATARSARVSQRRGLGLTST